jgi:hypothetical protein
VTAGQQIQPVVTGDGAEQFLVIWAGFTFSPASMDLFAQRYANVAAVLQPMSAPFVYAPFVLNGNGVYQPQLQVSWPALPGISVSNYEVFVDGAETPAVSTTNTTWTMTAAANSTHSFQLDYVTTDGRRPLLLSPPASGTTWLGYYAGTLPYVIPVEWMTMYFGPQSSWPSTTADSDGDGMNNYQEFQGGTIPTNSASVLVLRVQISKTTPAAKTTQGLQSSQNLRGIYLSWNTQPGLTYQVQVTTNFTTWSNVGGPQFAADTSETINLTALGQTNTAGYYRVVLLRQ